jgi:hypothetical protein
LNTEAKIDFKLLFPDALFDLNAISCASFMYFGKGNVGISLHPTVSMWLAGFDPFDFCRYVASRKPGWGNDYFILFKLWSDSNERLQQTGKYLEPLLSAKDYKSIWLAYPKTEESLEKIDKIISTSGLMVSDCISIINPDHAAQELFAHIHFEKVLELYGSPENPSPTEFIKRELDFSILFDYCNSFFKKWTLQRALVNSYFFRIASLGQFGHVMLSNERLLPILGKFQKDSDMGNEKNLTEDEAMDVASWELFRQIVSPYIDDKDKILRGRITSDFINTRSEEIFRLKEKCNFISRNLGESHGFLDLQNSISKHVEAHVKKEIRDLLLLDESAFADIKNKIFSDEKSWMGLLGFLGAVFTGGELITAGAGLVTLSSVLAKTYEVKSGIGKTINKSDYALIYRIHKI